MVYFLLSVIGQVKEGFTAEFKPAGPGAIRPPSPVPLRGFIARPFESGAVEQVAVSRLHFVLLGADVILDHPHHHGLKSPIHASSGIT
ncbi:MAG: hypothetical protein ACLUEV_05540 [Alistipes sp.]